MSEDDRGEDQQRPMPEVDRVGDVAEELDRRQLSAGDGAQRTVGSPANMTASVPATGSIAAAPGNGVAFVKASAAMTIAPSPSHDSASAAPASRTVGGNNASRPPTPNSHARVGVTKYAAAGFVAVAQSA